MNQRMYVGSVLLGYEAVSLGKGFPRFLRYHIPSKRQKRTTHLKVKQSLYRPGVAQRVPGS